MNKVILLGRLTKAVEIKYSQSKNIKIATFSLAVNRNYIKEGEERQTDFINIVAFSKTAEFLEKHISKGQQICISGRIQTRSFDDSNGQKRYVTEVIAEEVYFADAPKKADVSILNSKPIEAVTNSEVSDLDQDDLPF